MFIVYKKLGFYDVNVAYLFGFRSMVARNKEQQPRKRPLLYERSLLCTPPFFTFNEIPKYKEIDNLNTTLHLIINNFIKNQLKVVLRFDSPTNNFTTNQHKTGLNTVLNFDFITNLGRFLTNPDCNSPVQLFFHHNLIRCEPVKDFHRPVVDFKFNTFQFLVG